MKVPFPVFRSEGRTSRQAHTNMPAGTYEREKGREGFSDAVTHFYHRRPPMAFSDVEGPSYPRLFDMRKYSGQCNSPHDALTVFKNDHAKFRVWRLTESMNHLTRNADGDDLIFIHEGSGDMFCDFGHLDFKPGDYIVIPRGTSWRLETKTPVMALLLEATGDYFRLPDRGLMGVNAIFDPGMMDAPQIDAAFQAQKDDPTVVLIKRRSQITKVTFPHNPLDAVGWKGNVMPLRINWRDIRPVMAERYHMPPSAHSLFMSDRIVVGTFAPRPMESAADALKTSFFHNNDDYDEVGFLHWGDFMSKDGVGAGCLFHHPNGVDHGPHPTAYAKAEAGERKYSNEVLYFFETRDPLELCNLPAGIEFDDYKNSWKGWHDVIAKQAAE